MTHRKILTIISVFIITVLGIVGFSAEYKAWQNKNEIKDAHDSLKKFAALCLKEFPANSSGEKIKNLRHCVNVKTRFSANKYNVPLWEDKDQMAGWLFDYAARKNTEPPPMECSFRSGTLVLMLEALGFKSRDIVITRDEDNFPDHVVIGVFNPETKKWEVHDPSYDVEFLSLQDNKPLGIKRMLRSGPQYFQPCNFEGQCGWNLKTREGFNLEYNRGYWNTAWIKADRTLYVSKHFDENKKRLVNGSQQSYCEFRAKWCRNVVHLK